MNIKRILERITGCNISISYTDNRVNIISFTRRKGEITLRLQRIFMDAPLDVVQEIGQLLKNPRRKTPLINEFFRRNRWRIRKKARLSGKIEPIGRFYNLRRLFDSLNRKYFDSQLDAVITWGRRSPVRAVRKRTLGSYNAETRTIRINPILDSPRVPRYFIEYVIYHEMLHAYLGIKRDQRGRMRSHTPQFRELERRYCHYNKAIEWEKRLQSR